MADTQAIFVNAMVKLLAEIFEGPPGSEAYILNPGDPGLLRQLEAIDAATASKAVIAGRSTIAAHVDHLLYGFSLLNRWADGEENPWADADGRPSWKRNMVDDAAWRDLVQRLRKASERWKRAVASRREWDDLAAAGTISSIAHTAYHLGEIRQILAAAGKYEPVK